MTASLSLGWPAGKHFCMLQNISTSNNLDLFKKSELFNSALNQNAIKNEGTFVILFAPNSLNTNMHTEFSATKQLTHHKLLWKHKKDP